MSLNWLFEIGTIGSPTYRISLVTETYSGNPYSGVIDPESFKGMPLPRVKTALGTFPKLSVPFKIFDSTGSYSVGSIENEPVIIRFLEDGVQTDSWRLKVDTVSKAYDIITINCVDYFSTLLEGYWPLTDLVTEAFPESWLSGSDRFSSVDPAACIPITFGTSAYIPLQSIAKPGATNEIHYILGEENGFYNRSSIADIDTLSTRVKALLASFEIIDPSDTSGLTLLNDNRM